MRKYKKIIVANWKMNPENLDEAKNILNSIKRISKNISNTQVIVCPPFIYLSSLYKTFSPHFFLGAQNAHHETIGPFTGEVSFSQLRQFKVSHVIVGHSERRKMGESDEMINKKIKSITSAHMTSILCVGEKVRDVQGDYLSVVRSQIIEGLRDVNKKSVDNIIIAYEPVWAIGGNEAMHSRDIHEMSIFIKKVLREIYGVIGDGIKILYGGSINSHNSDETIKYGNVSGLLIGHESLRPKDFSEILESIDRT